MTNKQERDKEESDKWKQRLPRGGADSGRGPRALTDRGMINDRSRNHLNVYFWVCHSTVVLCKYFCAIIFYHLVDRVHDAGAACFDLFHLIGQLARGLDKDPLDLVGKQKQLTSCLCYIGKWFMWRWDEKRCTLPPIPWKSCCKILKPTGGSFSSLFLIAMQYLKVGKMSIDDKLQIDILGQKQTRS